MKSTVRRFMPNKFLQTPEEYFTKEVMEKLDVIAHQVSLAMEHDQSYKN
jgi:hypothetical protein